MTIEDLIAEMQAVRQDNPALSISEVIRLFQIRATLEQTRQMRLKE